MVPPRTSLAVLCFAASAVATLRADTFGTGANAFIIDFVTIGNAGNANDSVAGGGAYYSPYGGVAYNYRMGVTEVPQAWIAKATSMGLTNVTAGPWTGNQPATGVTWYEAAAFVNWLNTSTGNQPAYNLTFNGYWTMAPWSTAEAWDEDPGPGVKLNLYRHKNARYFLPSENEWYKAAYHKNNGVTGQYWDYATGSDSPPTAVANGTIAGTAVFNTVAQTTAAVDSAGGLSSYGTRGQTGNVYEWTESDFDGVNDVHFNDRAVRGGAVQDTVDFLRASYRNPSTPAVSDPFIGFRVATMADTDGDGVPDPFETGTGIYVSPTDTGGSPANPDTDGDGLTDGQEVYTYHSDPNVKDTDSDGFEDGFEVGAGFNPTSAASTPETFSTILKSGAAAVEYRFNAANGISYRIEASLDLVGWSTIETNIAGLGGSIARFYSTVGTPRRFFRPRRN
jgi:formylglycine-generating enzyme